MHFINLRSKLIAEHHSFRETYERSPFCEAEEMELAVELFQVTSEAELEQFLGNLFKKAWRGIKAVRSSVTRPLGEVLKTVAQTALPFIATIAGTFLAEPAGGAVAGKLGSLLSQPLEALWSALLALQMRNDQPDWPQDAARAQHRHRQLLGR